jgi:hypothetical protein
MHVLSSLPSCYHQRATNGAYWYIVKLRDLWVAQPVMLPSHASTKEPPWPMAGGTGKGTDELPPRLLNQSSVKSTSIEPVRGLTCPEGSLADVSPSQPNVRKLPIRESSQYANRFTGTVPLA